MNRQNRRAFLQNSAAAAALVAMRGVASANSISEARRRDGSHGASVVDTPRYDLLLKGGHVIDPANERDGRMDVAVSLSKIAAVEKDIPANQAAVRVLAFLNIVANGMKGGLEQNVDAMDVKRCADTVLRYSDIIVGVKTARSEEHTS